MDLAIAAAAAGRFRLVIAGDGPDRARLEALAKRSGADVRFAGRVPDEELLALYATAGAVIFPPADEDYGYIALEAFLSKKPVVTCTDSGGPLEFVVDGENGRVVPPDAAAIARGDRRRSYRESGESQGIRRKRLREGQRDLLGQCRPRSARGRRNPVRDEEKRRFL